MIIMYTDGAAKGNPGPGGFGVVLKYKGNRKEISQGYRLTTNNRMELLAVITGLETIKQPGWKVRVYSDSKYVVDAVTKGWIWKWQKNGFKKKKNVDLWQRFIPVYKKHDVEFKWVKGHAGHPENERCDQLAVKAAEGNDLLEDQGFKTETDL
ncbi:MAG: ribonuclease HI [Cyclobacteriaceae bacterium]|nr:ribonuclease HI [Cyclobacteriaceae bacterium]